MKQPVEKICVVFATKRQAKRFLEAAKEIVETPGSDMMSLEVMVAKARFRTEGRIWNLRKHS